MSKYINKCQDEVYELRIQMDEKGNGTGVNTWHLPWMPERGKGCVAWEEGRGQHGELIIGAPRLGSLLLNTLSCPHSTLPPAFHIPLCQPPQHPVIKAFLSPPEYLSEILEEKKPHTP